MASLLRMLFAGLISLNIVTTLAAITPRTPEDPCSKIPAPEVPGAEVLSFYAQARFKVPINPLMALINNPALINATVDICDVNVTVTHPGLKDKVTTTVWLPLKDWNGRLQGVGGGGWSAGGSPDYALFVPVMKGYAAALTDGGNIATNGLVGPQALSAPGQVNLGLLTDFASRGLHEIAVVGKVVTASFYGKAPNRSYWNGCSTGGRQGYMLAQKYPTDFDGIMAAAPALHWPAFILTLVWPQFVMNALKYYPPPCEMVAFQEASIEACDGLYGPVDGIIDTPEQCNFDPFKVVGKVVNCNGKPITLSNQAALIVSKIREGPRSPRGTQLWPGNYWGIDYSFTANTIQDASGKVIPIPSPIGTDWIKWFIKKDPNFQFSSITALDEFADLFAEGYSQYGGTIGTDQPDLSAFRLAGGKLLTWHGERDEAIMAENTLRYRRAVESVVGDPAQVNDFYRLFLAPGAGHCGGGYGPVPVDPLADLVNWVENGIAPETIFANFTTEAKKPASRELCLWPKVSKYNGLGDPNSAKSYSCANPS